MSSMFTSSRVQIRRNTSTRPAFFAPGVSGEGPFSGAGGSMIIQSDHLGTVNVTEKDKDGNEWPARLGWSPELHIDKKTAPHHLADEFVEGRGLVVLAKTLTAMMNFFDMFDDRGVQANKAIEYTMEKSRKDEETPNEAFLSCQREFHLWQKEIFRSFYAVEEGGLNLGAETDEMLDKFSTAICSAFNLTYGVEQAVDVFTAQYRQFRKCAETWEAYRLHDLNQAKTNGVTEDMKDIEERYLRWGMRPLEKK